MERKTTALRYSQSHPEVNREAAARYSASHPEIHREMVARYSASQSEVNRDGDTRMGFDFFHVSCHVPSKSVLLQLRKKVSKFIS